jgi:hypothetical protein
MDAGLSCAWHAAAMFGWLSLVSHVSVKLSEYGDGASHTAVVVVVLVWMREVVQLGAPLSSSHACSSCSHVGIPVACAPPTMTTSDSVAVMIDIKRVLFWCDGRDSFVIEFSSFYANALYE